MRQRIHFWSILTVLAGIGLAIYFGGGLQAQELQNQTVVETDDMVIVLAGYFADGRKHDLAGVGATASIEIEGETLQLSGEIEKGTYYQDGRITFVGTLGLTEDFDYKKGDVALTLGSSNGEATVTVRKSALKSVTFSALVTVELTVGNAVEPLRLKLEGSMEGKYDREGFDLDGTLKLREPFEYKHPQVVVRMTSGSVDVEVKKSEFQEATLDVVVEVDVEVSGSHDLVLGGEVEGKYDDSGMDLEGDLTLKREFHASGGAVALVLTGGDAALELKRDVLSPLTFLNLAYKVRVEVEGEDMEGEYDDGVFRLGSEGLENLGVKELVVEPDDDNDDTNDVNDKG